MIKLLNILSEIVVQKDPTLQKIADYVRGGSKGDLNLSKTPIQTLPPGFKVGGGLYLKNTPIQSLPDGLEVRGYLDLEDCKNLKSLPPGLEVGGGLYLGGTPISEKYTEEEIQKMVPGVKGDIYL